MEAPLFWRKERVSVDLRWVCLVLFGSCIVFLWPQVADAKRCKRRYRCFSKRYCSLKRIRHGRRKGRYRNVCGYRRYCKWVRVCKRWQPPPPPPPPPGMDQWQPPPPPRSTQTPSGGAVMPSAIPKEELQRSVKSYLPSIFGCFKQQIRRQPSFRGVQVSFTIRGDRGRVGLVGFEDASSSYKRLKRCIRRQTRRWRFKRFNGSAVIIYPIYLTVR